MAKADTSVKYFHSAMPGAPVLNGTAGSLIAVMDACLVTGFGLKTVDSLIVAGNVATANISTGHSAEKDTVVLIAGATPTELNGEWKVASTTTNTITFVTAGILDQTAAGTITLKLAPAGWAKPYSGTNLAAYKPTEVTATGCLLRVDDTGARASRVVGYETMSDVNTGTGQFPTALQKAGGDWWSKSQSADTATRPWMLVSDGRIFYFGRCYYPGYLGCEVTTFGDLNSSKSGDAFACVISGMPSDFSQSPSGLTSAENIGYSHPGGMAELYAARSQTGLGSSTPMRKAIPLISGSSISALSGSQGMPYPNPQDGGLYVAPHYAIEHADASLRGLFPGFYGCCNNIPHNTFVLRDSVTGISALPGKVLKAMTLGSSPVTPAFIDVTGPWR